ncbi:ABC transporter permease [Nonomuraea sp. SYSU D8015]|uniref:ABC transporter permease n=1 Tax=Nonomuraea sp. SYSU D8015 TaxID=2593644 RepID=UPI001660E95B|nr:ABC transporter permease [Nonomuraea sp. SYSU D8015]
MRQSLIILAKDLRQRTRDSTLLVFGVVLPLGLAFLFNLMLGGGERRLEARYAVADLDRGTVAQEFVTQVLEPLRAAGDVTIRPVAGAEEGRRLVGDKAVDAVFVIPAGFSAAMQQGRPTALEIVGGADSAVAVQVAREIAQGYANERRMVQLAVTVAGGQATDRELIERAAAAPRPLELAEDSATQRRQLDSTTYYSAGMAMFFLFFVTMMSVTSIFDERREGTLARLLVAPITRRAILLGKSLGGVLVGVLSMVILITVSTLALGADWGNPLGVAALAVAAVLAATGVTAAVATFARTTEQASNRLSVIAMVLGLFGGALFPIAQLEALSFVSVLTPHHWFLQGLGDLAGGSLAVVVVPVLMLLGFAVTGGALALHRLGRMLHW